MIGDKDNGNDHESDGKDKEPVLITAHNNGHLNSFNPVQLSAWRANVDMHAILYIPSQGHRVCYQVYHQE